MIPTSSHSSNTRASGLRRLSTVLFCAVAVAVPVSPALAQNSAFTYQGKLEEAGRPVTGLYEMTFNLHDTALDGTPLATLPPKITPVTNGLFTVMLEFGSTPFDGAARFLQIHVRSNGVPSAPAALLPRTALGSAPHATYAARAGSVAAGRAVTSLNNLKDDVMLAAGDNITLNKNGNTITVASTGGAFAVNGAVAYYNGGKVGIGTSTPSAALDVVGNWDGENGALTLHGTKPSLRFTGDASSANQSWLMHLGNYQGGALEFYRRTGPGAWAQSLALLPNSDVSFSPTTKLNFGSQVRQMLNLWGTDYGIGVQAMTVYQRSYGGFAWYQRGSHSDLFGDAGAGGRPLMSLDGLFLTVNGLGDEKAYIGGDGNGDVQVGSRNPAVSLVGMYNAGNNTWMDVAAQNVTAFGDVHTANSAHGMGYRNTIDGGLVDGPFIYGWDGGALGVSGPDSITLSWNWEGNVWVRNNLSTCSLTIRGGCDLAEPFKMSEQHIPKGAVVVIDEENEGQLKMSSTAYDTRVAGIVSGANGINPGISLTQTGRLDEGENVALAGRVYAQVETGNGPIKPGDLLTTSDIPGHLMKVTDHSRAPGAVVGKAMSSLADGRGMVLVLVNLQ